MAGIDLIVRDDPYRAEDADTRIFAVFVQAGIASFTMTVLIGKGPSDNKQLAPSQIKVL